MSNKFHQKTSISPVYFDFYVKYFSSINLYDTGTEKSTLMCYIFKKPVRCIMLVKNIWP